MTDEKNKDAAAESDEFVELTDDEATQVSGGFPSPLAAQPLVSLESPDRDNRMAHLVGFHWLSESERMDLDSSCAIGD